jgi:uroporphyrinogen-III synthase
VRHTIQLLEQQFGENWREPLERVQLISIGPQTSKTLQALLGRVDAEANPHDLDGLVAACSLALKD